MFEIIDSDRKVSLRKCVPFFSHHDGRFNSNIDDPIIIAYATVLTTLLLTTPTVSHFTEIRSSLFSLIVFFYILIKSIPEKWFMPVRHMEHKVVFNLNP